MRSVRTVIALGGAALLLSPKSSGAQSFPVTPPSMEVQVGAAAITLPEQYDGLFGWQAEVRWGMFLLTGLQLQIQGDARIWPLGAKAPKNYGGAGHLAWYPRMGDSRNLYLLVGVGGGWSDPPKSLGEARFNPLGRAGIGYKVSLEDLGIGFLRSWHFTSEFRVEGHVLEDSTEILSGVGLGMSYFL